MRVLVTGALGFIGKAVCASLEKRGHEVVRLDVWAEASSGGIVADITKGLKKLPDVDAVVHLAAMAAPRECDANPTRAFDVNVNGTLQVLKAALEAGAKKAVFASSAHVYGVGPRYLPTDETHPLSLGNTYTTTKILGEQLCELYHENHGLSYTTLRLFNVYGPGQGRGYFIPDQIGKANAGGFVLRGSDVTKDWVYIDDVALAFALAVESPFVGAINIGTGIETGLGSIGKRIAAAYQAEVILATEPHPTRMCADISRAKRVLGWSPTVGIGEGVDAIIGSRTAASIR